MPGLGYDLDFLIDGTRITVNQLLPSLGSTATFIYDFGDWWTREVVVESGENPTAGVRYPTCLDGENACPPEDCGGPWGYAEMLKAIADPTHEQHEDMVAWAPPGFDATDFDVAAVNRRLATIR